MAEVRLRAAAEADLADILDHGIEQFGKDVAHAYLRSFERAFDLLRRHPQAGTLHGDVLPPVRSLSHRSHRIFYDIDGETVWIVRVLHHAMDERRWLPC